MSAKKTARKSSKSSKRASKKASATASASAKHAAHVKHEEHLAHEAHLKAIGKVTTKAKPATHAKAKKVAFGIGDWLPVCAFEAVAQSLRVLGQPVHGDEVAALWELCGAAEATSIEDALVGAAMGLAGYVAHGSRARLVHVDRVSPGPDRPSVLLDGAGRPGQVEQVPGDDLDLTGRRSLVGTQFPHGVTEVHALILGIDRPGPHAVLATADGWWSWGELHDPWPCDVREAWAVSWEAGRDSNPRPPFNARPARCSAAELPALPALILGAAA